jgi:hypothetical protein
MYARRMSVREIRAHLEELFGIDVSADLISAVTDAVLERVAEWQNRPLDVCLSAGLLRPDFLTSVHHRLRPLAFPMQTRSLPCDWPNPLL